MENKRTWAYTPEGVERTKNWEKLITGKQMHVGTEQVETNEEMANSRDRDQTRKLRRGEETNRNREWEGTENQSNPQK